MATSSSSSIWDNHYELEADFVTANVNLWPRPLVIVAGTDVFESLDADQQAVLSEASANAVPGALEASREEDTSGGEGLCGAGMTFTTASADELDALRSALDPVYASLAEDPATAEFLDAIKALKEQVGAPPDAAECVSAERATDTGADEASIPNGTYTTTITREEALTTCPDLVPDEFPGDESTYELTLDDGEVTLMHESGGERDITLTGSYTVFRDLFTLETESETSMSAPNGRSTATPSRSPTWRRRSAGTRSCGRPIRGCSSMRPSDRERRPARRYVHSDVDGCRDRGIGM